MQAATKVAPSATTNEPPSAPDSEVSAHPGTDEVATVLPATKRACRSHDDITVFRRTGRGDKWYFRLQVDGKSITRCTGCTDKRAALKNATFAAKAARARDWTTLDATAMRPGYSIVSDLLAIYREHAPDRSGEATARRFLRYVTSACSTSAPEKASTREALDPTHLRTWIHAQEKAGRSPAGIHSDVQSIKSVVARTRSHIYSTLTLPDLEAFRSVTGGSSVSEGYQPVARESLRRMDSAARIPLRRRDPATWGTYWLMRRAGLRNSEVGALRWSWIEEQPDGSADIVLIKRKEWQPKGSGGRIPISRRFLRLLRAALPVGEEDFVIPRENITQAKEITERTINAFVRPFLPDREKGAYTLRMEFGSRIAARDGIEVASRLLRHADISTTFHHYHSLLKRPSPL